jgi:hypothetical protein
VNYNLVGLCAVKVVHWVGLVVNCCVCVCMYVCMLHMRLALSLSSSSCLPSVFPIHWLSSSLFSAVASPIPLINLFSSSSVLSVSTPELVWATCALPFFSRVRLVSILLSAEREFCRNYVICDVLPLYSRSSSLKFQ